MLLPLVMTPRVPGIWVPGGIIRPYTMDPVVEIA